MTNQEFEKVLQRRLSEIRKVLESKAEEYAHSVQTPTMLGETDRLYNFKRAAQITGETPEKALMGMFMKHLVSVFDLVEGKLERTPIMVGEKIGDAINYLILLEALFTEDWDSRPTGSGMAVSTSS